MHNKSDEAQGIQSVQLGHRLLRALLDERTPLSLGQLAVAAEMSTSKARGYLLSYLQLGLVRQLSPGGLYDLGPEALHLGLAALGRVDAVNLAREALPAFHQEINETVCLSVWSDFGPVVFDKLDGPRQTAFALRIGTTAGLLTTATGRVFLAYLPESQSAAVLKREIKQDLLGIAAELRPDEIRAEVHAYGLATVQDLTLPGFSSIAAPITDQRGALALVVNIVGPSRSIDLSPSGKMARALKIFASEISAQAGGEQFTARSKATFKETHTAGQRRAHKSSDRTKRPLI